VTTATKYRQFAQECIDSAQAATSETVHEQFLDIAKLWLMTAAKLDAGVGLETMRLRSSEQTGRHPRNDAG
jgi:hypothetical protein